MPKSLCFAIIATTIFVATSYAGEPTGRIVGKVTVEKTREPVAGATIRVLTGMSEDQPGRKYAIAETRTNEKGEYELTVPFGNVWLQPPDPPAGYWNVNAKPLDQLVVARKEPRVERSFQVAKGTVWRLKLETGAAKPVTGADIQIVRNADNSLADYRTDPHGECRLTMPRDGGKLRLGCGRWSDPHTNVPIIPKLISLEIAADFDPATAEIAERPMSGKPVRLTDKHGRIADVEGCAVVLDNGSPQLRLTVVQPSASQLGEIVGKVVDREGRPVKDAVVTCRHSLLFPPDDSCMTDDLGAFRFRGFFKPISASDKSAFLLMVLKDGYAGIDFGDFKGEAFSPGTEGVQQLPHSLVLVPGYSARLRILDADGAPVEGAWVEPNGGYALRAQFTKSDREGYCAIRNLPEAVTRLDVHSGDQYASADIVVSATSATEEPVAIHLSKLIETAQQQPSQQVPAPKLAKPGENAPEWSISGWTDGKNHKLSDFRGKVVLLDFWGVWCSGCVKAIPALKRVHEKFGDRIAMVGIHTPGTEISQIKKLLGLKDWDALVGLDKGPDLNGTAGCRVRVSDAGRVLRRR